MGLICLVSLATNFALYMGIRKLRNAPAPVPNTSYDATMLLHDLTSGKAMVKIERIAPESVFIRSMRDV
jgi:hypothetical protein